MSAPVCNDEFDVPDGSYFMSNIQVYFEYIKQLTENSQIQIYAYQRDYKEN